MTRHTKSFSFNSTLAQSTNLFLSPSDPIVLIGITRNTIDLTADEIFQCITSMSTLNLTIKSEITISYINHKNPKISNSGYKLTSRNTTALNSSYPQREVNAGQGTGSLHAQQRDASPESATGSCSISIAAPPDQILSILFLNQTCSRDNVVRVHDIHDGRSTTLDGCSPWISPGYDVTTANRLAVIVIDLHSLVDFFRLNVQVRTQDVRTADGFIIRYVSRVLGYTQTPGWHSFARPFTGTTHGTATVMVPSNHGTLISVVYISMNCFYFARIILITRRKNWDRPQTEWKYYCDSNDTPGAVLRDDLTEFRVEFDKVPGYIFNGVRMLFSFYTPVIPPQRDPGGLWNCSVPSWSFFHQHFACNYKTECAGREDELWCPDTSCQQDGILLDDRCFIFLRLPYGKNSWHHGNAACKQRGAALASFPTVNSWYHLSLLIQIKPPGDDYCYIGLQSPDASYPHIYFGTGCALCQMMSSTLENSPQVNIGKRKTWHRSATQTLLNIRDAYRKRPPFNGIFCPDQHWTHGFLAYDAFSACCHDYDAASGNVNNVTTDSTVAPLCAEVDATSFKALFLCKNGASSVPYSLVCDHLQDCADNSDEDFCVFPPCSDASKYKCANSQCLQSRYLCDELLQCVDGSDEADCTSNDFQTEQSVLRLRPPAVEDFDGRGWIVYTQLTIEKEESAVVCPDTHVFCPGDGYCLPVYVRCNGLYDCPGREDEDGCERYTCPSLYRCRGLLNTCLHPDHLCDGWPQCSQHDDELFCNFTCPVNCICLGHAFACSNDFHVELFSRLRYLDASGAGLKPERLYNNLMLVYLSLANCDLAHLSNVSLPNLLSLDLSDNRLGVVTVAQLKLMENLQNLSLARNPLTSLFSGNYSSGFHEHKGILRVDLTGIEIKVLDMPSSLPFPNLLSLNMSGSGVTRLIGDGFQSLASLHIIDLRGCPMTVFPRRVFKDLKKLHSVFADKYKLCCKANLPEGFSVENCQAPFNEISSCDALLRADVYRICLFVLAVLALIGNLGCFSLRIFSIVGRGKTGFNVFVTHLCASDFVMGVYMAIIGVADRMYLGRYLWEEGRWRHSTICQVAGVLAFLSSEVSALIICLITLDRFLVIRFPFSRLRFSSFSAQVASLITWIMGALLVSVPVLPVIGYKHFYGQTGICVPLPITRNDFTGHHYAFGVMILLNLIVFLVIATGQISVYMSMAINPMSSIDTSRKSRDLIVARRLITVVVSDFLCWFPVGLLGVLAAQGVPIPGEVNVAMAIFVLPLNSALNPFLYTLNIIQDKRQRATEVKLLKLIMDRGVTPTVTP